MREKKGKRHKLRRGYTTGACAAAASKAGTRAAISKSVINEIESTLPNGSMVVFKLKRCDLLENAAICSIIKDAGDDPDCTHGAEITASVRLSKDPGVKIIGGEGVAQATKPGLEIPVGAPSITPVPRKNIIEMTTEELKNTGYDGAEVTISVPGGAEMAKKTLNSRLGLIGGISILGTTGIVKPYSTSAYKASVLQAIDVARAMGRWGLVFTTGGRSEEYAMKLMPEIPEDAFIQVGDFIGAALKRAAERRTEKVVVATMIGKLAKMADGQENTHARKSQVDMELLARLAAEHGASPELREKIAQANTARHVLELCRKDGFNGIFPAICSLAYKKLHEMAGNLPNITALLLDFDGGLIYEYPEGTAVPSQNMNRKEV